jgi:hypothetical protein
MPTRRMGHAQPDIPLGLIPVDMLRVGYRWRRMLHSGRTRRFLKKAPSFRIPPYIPFESGSAQVKEVWSQTRKGERCWKVRPWMRIDCTTEGFWKGRGPSCRFGGEASRLRTGNVIIIHLLGLAPTGCLASPDNGAMHRQSGDCMKLHTPTVPFNPLIWCTARKPRGEEDYDPGFGRVIICHTRTILP